MFYGKILLPIFFGIYFGAFQVYSLELSQQKLKAISASCTHDKFNDTNIQKDICIAYHIKKTTLPSSSQSYNHVYTCDYNKLTDQIIYVIHQIQSWMMNYVISSCQACQDDDIWIQLNDVIINGQAYQYFVLTEKAKQQSKYNACYLLPYDGSEDIYFPDRAQFEKALYSPSSILELDSLLKSGLSGSSSQQNSFHFQAHAQFNNQSKYQVNPSHQKTNNYSIPQSLSNKNGLQHIDAQQEAHNRAFMNQNMQALNRCEQYFNQRYPGLADQIKQDRQNVFDAHQDILQIYKDENPSRIRKFFGKNPVIHDHYTDEQLKHAHLIVQTGGNNPYGHRKEVIEQAKKIIQSDEAIKAQVLKNQQDQIASEKKIHDSNHTVNQIELASDNNCHNNQLQAANNLQINTVAKILLQATVQAYKKDIQQQGALNRSYEKILQEEQQQATYQKYIQQQNVQNKQINRFEEQYVQQKIMELSLLEHHGYTYQASNKDFTDLIVHQLQLDVAHQNYNAINSLSYEYLLSGKPKELKNLMQDFDTKINYLKNKMIKDQSDWHQKSLEEIAVHKKYQQSEILPVHNCNQSDRHEQIDYQKIVPYQYPVYDVRSSQNLIKNSEHTYTMPSSIAQTIREHLIPLDNQYTHKVSDQEATIINCMLSAMGKATNSMTVEFAQAGLQACHDAQKALTDQEYNHCMNKAQWYYNHIKDVQHSNGNIDHKVQVTMSDLDSMVQHYDEIIHNDHTAVHSQQGIKNIFIDRLHDRTQALYRSQEQLRTKKFNVCTINMSFQARGYLMAHHLNYAAFDAFMGTDIQKCLMQENLEIIESVIDMAQRTDYDPRMQDMVVQICNQAIIAQQLNQRSQIQQAALLTDLNYINAYFEQIAQGENIFLDIAIGTAQGHAQFLCKWAHFLKNIYQDPVLSLNSMKVHVSNLASGLSNITSALYNFTPLAHDIDATLDYFGLRPDQAVNDDGTYMTYTEQRSIKKDQIVSHIMRTINSFVEYIQQNSVRTIITDTTELVDGFCFDAYLTDKAIMVAGSLAGKVGQHISWAGDAMYDLLPVELMDEVITYAKTSSGEIIAISDKTGVNIGIAAVNQAVINKTEKIKKSQEKINCINDKVCKLTKGNPKKIEALRKSMESHLRSDKIVDVERLKKITDIEQINAYKRYTNNFHPEGIAKLKPEEILHLNLCEWLEPQARKINERIQASGGLKIVEVKDGIECITEIYELDLFHSLLNDVKPGSISGHASGGHLFISELHVALLDTGNLELLQNGYFDLGIKYVNKIGNFRPKTYFPIGTSIEEVIVIIENVLHNPQSIKCVGIDIIKNKSEFEIISKIGQKFKFYVNNGKVRFFPSHD